MNEFVNGGLSAEEVRKRLQEYGRNEIFKTSEPSPFSDFLSKLRNPLALVLVFAAGLSAYFGNWINAIIIVVMLLMSSVLDFINTYKSQKAAEALKKRVQITATVVRNNKEEELSLVWIVPGDIVLLSPGDIVPADGKLITAKDFFVDESVLTGESFPVEKFENNEAWTGTSVVTGNAAMEVISTGGKTKFSKIAETLIKREAPTDFDKGIRNFSVLVLKIIIILVVSIFLLNAFFRHSWLDSLLFATALAIGLTPELLPMIITVNLAKGSAVMSRHGVIVKKLSAIQSLGTMDLFCTDKTGTLTEAKIVLVKYIDGLGNESEKVFRAAYLNSNYHSGIRNHLDKAIKDFKSLDISGYSKIDEIPFDYHRKRDSIVVENKKERILLVKGAPETVVETSRFYLDSGREIDANLKKQMFKTYEDLSRQGFHVLGVAEKSIKEIKPIYSKDEEKDLVFLGFVAFWDPPKQGISDTLKKISDYGIETKIFTGDNELVAKKIAEEIKLPLKGILTGKEVESLSNEELSDLAEKTTIFARISPDQKKRLIEILRSRGHIVGYLGDGINDAPSLRAADVGISVNNGVDVAKESADFILLTKNLHILITGIIEGRKTFVNTLKYMKMVLSSNFGNMVSMAGASIFLPFLPMLPTQILLNNFLYDASQLTIPTDNVDEEEIKKPKKWDMNFIKKFMLVFGPLSSVFDILTFIILLFVFKLTAAGFQTGWFLESLATQTLVIFVIRSKKITFLQTRPSAAVVIGSLAAVILSWYIVFTSFGGLFGFKPLTVKVSIAIFLIVLIYLVLAEILKKIFYKKNFG